MNKEQALSGINKLIDEGNTVLKTAYGKNSDIFGYREFVNDDLFDKWKNKLSTFLSLDGNFSKSYEEFSKEPIMLETNLDMSKKYFNILLSLKECIEEGYITLLPNENPKHQENSGTVSVFIGHGHNLLWARIALYLSDKLHIKPKYFEDSSRLGSIIPAEIENFINDGTIKMAIFTMMNEDETTDGTLLPRQNVVDEAARFSTKLGRDKVIIVKEKGPTIPSNLQGIMYIEYEQDQHAVLLKIKEKLEEEGLL